MEVVEQQLNSRKGDVVKYFVASGVSSSNRRMLVVNIFVRVNDDVYLAAAGRRGNKMDNNPCCCFEINNFYKKNELVSVVVEEQSIKVACKTVHTTNSLQDFMCTCYLFGIVFQTLRIPLNNQNICVWKDDCCMKCLNNACCDTYSTHEIVLDRVSNKIGDLNSVREKYSSIYTNDRFKEFLQ